MYVRIYIYIGTYPRPRLDARSQAAKVWTGASVDRRQLAVHSLAGAATGKMENEPILRPAPSAAGAKDGGAAAGHKSTPPRMPSAAAAAAVVNLGGAGAGKVGGGIDAAAPAAAALAAPAGLSLPASTVGPRSRASSASASSRSGSASSLTGWSSQTGSAAEQRDLQLYDTDHDGRLNHIERTIKRYDTDGDGAFSTTEVKAIVQDLETAQRGARSAWHVSIGVILMSVALFGALFAVMIAANEISKDTRVAVLLPGPASSPDSGGGRDHRQLAESGSSVSGALAAARQVVLEDKDGNVVATDGTPKWNSKVTSLANALQVPDAQPVFALDRLSNAQLSRLQVLTVDTSAALDGSDLTIYRVTAARAWRPPPGASGRPNPPEITVQTAAGDTIQVKNGQAVIRDGDGKLKHTLTANGAALLRRRNRRLLQSSYDGGGADSDEEPRDVLERAEHNLPPPPPPPARSEAPPEPPLSWRDVTVHAENSKAKKRRLSTHEHDRSGGGNGNMDPQAFVRRRSSNTSFVYELSHADKPTDFDGQHHGIEAGAIISLPLCTAGAAGQVKQFTLHAGDIIPDELQRAFPNVRSYHATEWPSGAATADVTVDSTGVRAQIWSGADHPRCFVDPHTIGRADRYTVYSILDEREDDGEPLHTPPPAANQEGETTFATPDELNLNSDGGYITSMLDEQHPEWRHDGASAAFDRKRNGYHRQLRDTVTDGANPPAGTVGHL